MNQTNLNLHEDEIDLLPLLKAVKKKLPVIIAIALVGGIIAACISLFMITPMYRTDFRVYVNNKADNDYQESLTSADVSAARSLASTYAEIIESRTVLQSAAENCGLGSLDYEKQLLKLVSAEPSDTTELITVYVKGTSPSNALYLAQAVAMSAQSRVSNIIEGSSMVVVDEPYMPTEKYSPSNAKNAIIGAILGGVLAAGIVVVKEIMDTRVKDEQTLEERFGIPVLGTVPNFADANKSSSYSYSHGGYGYAAASAQSKKKKAAKPAASEEEEI